jgi:hypothetical protein
MGVFAGSRLRSSATGVFRSHPKGATELRICSICSFIALIHIVFAGSFTALTIRISHPIPLHIETPYVSCIQLCDIGRRFHGYCDSNYAKLATLQQFPKGSIHISSAVR